MTEFIVLNEILDIGENLITNPVYVKISSINVFKASQYTGTVTSTQVMLQNDCIWVSETPEEIIAKLNTIDADLLKKFGFENEPLV